MSDYITSLNAVLRLRNAGLVEPERTLALWAEVGQLRSRARGGKFSDDEDGSFRQFPNEPPADRVERDVAGPWPDVPSDFWYWANRAEGQAVLHFEAGVIGSTVFYDDRDGREDSQRIQLYGVSFKQNDLEQLLAGGGGIHPSPPL